MSLPPAGERPMSFLLPAWDIGYAHGTWNTACKGGDGIVLCTHARFKHVPTLGNRVTAVDALSQTIPDPANSGNSGPDLSKYLASHNHCLMAYCAFLSSQEP
jgi:hypothetical protein